MTIGNTLHYSQRKDLENKEEVDESIRHWSSHNSRLQTTASQNKYLLMTKNDIFIIGYSCVTRSLANSVC